MMELLRDADCLVVSGYDEGRPQVDLPRGLVKGRLQGERETMKPWMKMLVIVGVVVAVDCLAISIEEARENVKKLEEQRVAYIKEQQQLPGVRSATDVQKKRATELTGLIKKINDSLPSARKALDDAEKVAKAANK